MKKFKIKNRQKRKYTRHKDQQDTYQFTPFIVGVAPIFIIAVAFATILFIQQSIPDPTMVFAPEITLPTFSLPTISISVPAFSGSFTWLEVLLNIIGTGFIAFGQTLHAIGITTFDGLIRVWELLMQSFASVFSQMVLGSQTIVDTFVQNALWTQSALLFLLQKLFELLVFCYNGLMAFFTFVGLQVAAFFETVWKFILLPFQVMGAMWLKVKPFFDTVGMYFVYSCEQLASSLEIIEGLRSSL